MTPPRRLLVLPGLCLALLPGCVTEVVQRGPSHSVGVPELAPPRRRSETGGLAAAILPLGSVPYDGRSLPLLSPEGSLVATEAGDPPGWPTLLAEPGAPVAPTTGVQIWQLDDASGEPRGVAVVQEPVLLGRCADGAGFLVESPQPDGSRRVGRVAWGGGPVRWLVADEHVNAFASLGPRDGLAWSRRGDAEPYFDLVVRRGGDEQVLSAQGGDWLAPLWSDDGTGLYVLRLEHGRLELRYLAVGAAGVAASTAAALALADDATRADAYQVLAAAGRTLGVRRAAGGEHLIFWHPGARRMAIWRPIEAPGAAALLAEGSIAAAIDPGGLALVATPEHLLVQRPANAADRRVLVPGPQVPRPVSDERWPWVLLAPGDGAIGLMAFSVVGAE